MSRKPSAAALAFEDQILAALDDGLPRSTREIAATVAGKIRCNHGAGARSCASCGLTGMRAIDGGDVRSRLVRMERLGEVERIDLPGTILWHRAPLVPADDLAALDWDAAS